MEENQEDGRTQVQGEGRWYWEEDHKDGFRQNSRYKIRGLPIQVLIVEANCGMWVRASFH